MISKRLKQLLVGSAAVAALAFGSSASAGAAASTSGSASATIATLQKSGSGDGWVHDPYLTDHEQYVRHHERLASAA